MVGGIENDVVGGWEIRCPGIGTLVGTKGLGYLDVGCSSIKGVELFIWNKKTCLVIRQQVCNLLSPVLSKDDLSQSGLDFIGGGPV
jgi:hypothetical protein